MISLWIYTSMPEQWRKMQWQKQHELKQNRLWTDAAVEAVLEQVKYDTVLNCTFRCINLHIQVSIMLRIVCTCLKDSTFESNCPGIPFPQGLPNNILCPLLLPFFLCLFNEPVSSAWFTYYKIVNDRNICDLF